MEVIKKLDQNSCELSVNAKGMLSGSIKVYAENIEDAKKLALAKANEIRDLVIKLNKLNED